MGRSVNKSILIGQLGRDAEQSFTPSGASVTKFSIATERSWKDKQSNEWKKETNWTNVVLWGQEGLGQYLLKGKQVYVEGRLQTRSWDDKEGKKVYTTEVIAEEVILLGGNSTDQKSSPGLARAASTPKSTGRNQQEDPFGGSMNITDDDLPF